LMDSPIDLGASIGEFGKDGAREAVVRAPALEIGVPRAIPVATGATERIRVYEATFAGEVWKLPCVQSSPGDVAL
jgi:hypothetical protein